MEGIVFLTFTIHSRQKSRWWQLKYFLFSSLPGEMIQFDDHIFQRGWFNHQQENPSTVAPGQRPSWVTQVAFEFCVARVEDCVFLGPCLSLIDSENHFEDPIMKETHTKSPMCDPTCLNKNIQGERPWWNPLFPGWSPLLRWWKHMPNEPWSRNFWLVVLNQGMKSHQVILGTTMTTISHCKDPY